MGLRRRSGVGQSGQWSWLLSQVPLHPLRQPPYAGPQADGEALRSSARLGSVAAAGGRHNGRDMRKGVEIDSAPLCAWGELLASGNQTELGSEKLQV